MRLQERDQKLRTESMQADKRQGRDRVQERGEERGRKREPEKEAVQRGKDKWENQEQWRRQKRYSKKKHNRFQIIYGMGLFLILVLTLLLLRRVERLEHALLAVKAVEIQPSDRSIGTDGTIEEAEKTDEISGKTGNFAAYARECEAALEDLDKPRKRSRWEALDSIEKLAEDREELGQILEQEKLYSDSFLEALSNNPELTAFALGYLEDREGTSACLTEEEKKMEFPLFLQWDPRWGYEDYGDESNIGLSGCGPTALAMALYYLTKDETILPDTIAQYAMENGYYLQGTGTKWALMEEVPLQYGVEVCTLDKEEELLREELERGNVVICSMGSGDFTAEGHFIVLYGSCEAGFLVNDPNCVARSRKVWPGDTLMNQIKQVWVLGKEESHF